MASKQIELPGLVDVHAHLREPGGTQKEDFETGTRAAIAGGYTQILDMPNNIPPTVTSQALSDKIKRAKGRIYCDLGFNFGATHESTAQFKNIYNKVFGLKIYMNQTTGTLLLDKDEEREEIFRAWRSTLPILVHAQGETVEIAIKLAKKYQRKLHICHVTADQLGSIKRAGREGLSITCEVCPHHLFLAKDDVQRLGLFGIMKPPLMSIKDQQKLWDNIDNIEIIATDHAPHTREEKLDQTEPKYGVPGLETTIPLFMKAVKDGRITLERFAEMTCYNPRKIFRLPEQEDTKVIIDFPKEYRITNEGLFTKSGWTPFKGLYGGGKVRQVFMKKKLVFENGRFVSEPLGEVIFPNTN